MPRQRIALHRAKQLQKAIAGGQGRTHATIGLLAYTGEQERLISRMPTYTQLRTALQKPDGSFKLRPGDDGSMHPGLFRIDEWGNFVTVAGGTFDSSAATFDSDRLTWDSGRV